MQENLKPTTGTQTDTLWWCIACAVLWLATFIFFLPLLRTFPEFRISSTHPDALEFIWTTWRLEGVLAGQKQLYYADELFAPNGASLLLHTVCEAILVPITALTTTLTTALPPVWRFNAALVVVFLLNSVAALSLLRALECPPLVATIASLLITFSPFVIGHLHAGHLNFIAIFALLEALRGMLLSAGLTVYSPTGRTLIASLRYAIAITLLAFTNLYYLYFAALACGMLVLHTLWARHREGTSIVRAASALCAPFIVGILPACSHLLAVAQLASSGTYSGDHKPALHAADLASLIVPSSVQRIGHQPLFTWLREGVALHAGESSVYLGLSVTILALVACRSGRQKATHAARLFVILAAVFSILSLGPTIAWRGAPLFLNPFDYVLRAVLPFYPSVPVRFAGVSYITLVLAAALSVLHLPRFRTKSVGSIALLFGVLIMGLLEYLPTPLGVYPLPLPSPALERLAGDTTVTVVADLSESPQYAMLRQTIHGKPITGGFLSRHPRKAGAALRRNRFTRLGRGQSSIKDEEAQLDWCTLHANRLVLELPVAVGFNARLSTIGFSQIDRDPYVAIFKPRDDLCLAVP